MKPGPIELKDEDSSDVFEDKFQILTIFQNKESLTGRLGEKWDDESYF